MKQLLRLPAFLNGGNMKNTFCFLVASTEGRTHVLNECVKALKHSKYNGSDVFLYYQGNGKDEIEDVSFFKDIIFDDKLRGVFTPRFELLKRYGIMYDYSIMIDDDLFVTKGSNYDYAIKAIENIDYVGCVATLNHAHVKSLKNKLVYVDHTNKYYGSRFNIEGGMIFPKKSVKEIVNFFAGKEQDYSEDMFWLLLYCLGYDLYYYLGSSAIHKVNVANVEGKPSGYIKFRHENEYNPILQDWYETPKPWRISGKTIIGIKQLYMITEEGLRERERNIKNRGKAENRD